MGIFEFAELPVMVLIELSHDSLGENLGITVGCGNASSVGHGLRSSRNACFGLSARGGKETQSPAKKGSGEGPVEKPEGKSKPYSPHFILPKGEENYPKDAFLSRAFFRGRRLRPVRSLTTKYLLDF